MECRHVYAINGITLAFFGSGSGVLDCDCFKNGDGFRETWRLVFIAKHCAPSPPKHHICQFFDRKKNIQNVAFL